MEFGFEIEEVTGNEVMSIRENSISDGLVQRERLRQVFNAFRLENTKNSPISCLDRSSPGLRKLKKVI